MSHQGEGCTWGLGTSCSIVRRDLIGQQWVTDTDGMVGASVMSEASEASELCNLSGSVWLGISQCRDGGTGSGREFV